MIERKTTKSGGWITERARLGPLEIKRTVAYRDRTRLHAWAVRVGIVTLEQGYHRGPVYLLLHIGRLDADLRLRNAGRGAGLYGIGDRDHAFIRHLLRRR